MNDQFDSQDLFGIYATEVGSYLPRRKRKDIQLEILSLLEDALEDKSAASGQPADEDMALEVLEEFGPPITFASAYRTDNTLIGPDIFQLFRPVLQVAAVIYVIQFLAGVAISLTQGSFDILETLDAFFDKGFQLFGVLVFAFALIERTTPTGWLRWPFKEMGRTWDPASLKKERRQQRIKPPQYWFEALLMLGVLALFTIFPHWVGFGSNTNGTWSFIPVLSESFIRYLPWIAAYFLIRVIFAFVLARQGYWDKNLRWFDIGIKAYGILLLVALITGPDIFGINESYLAMHTYSPDLLAWYKATLTDWNTGFVIYLVLMIIMQAVVLFRQVFRVLVNRQAVKFPVISKTNG